MLEAMRELALDFLHDKLGANADESPEAFYKRIRETAPERLFPFLVESVEKEDDGKDKPRYYTLSPAEDDPTVAVLEVYELKASDAAKLPFNQSSGPNSPALGPVVKRTAKKGGELNSPKEVIQDRTLAYFKQVAEEAFPWSPYFAKAWDCWNRPVLHNQSGTASAPGRTAYSLALDRIPEKRTVLFAFKDSAGRLPGEVPEYVNYLSQQLGEAKYLPDTVLKKGMTCPLCGDGPVDVFPNALRGAGINLANVNRDGAFPGIDASSAWKSFALCIACADLLYVYCKHVAGTYLTRVAGETALAIPSLNVADNRTRLITRLRDWVADATSEVTSRERQFLKVLGDQRSVNSITLLWAEFGNRIDDIRGIITDVLPSRLYKLSSQNADFNRVKMPLFPEIILEGFEYDLSLSMLRPLFHRPGGKKAQSRNDSRRLFDLRRDIADAIYHAHPLPWERFWAEIHETARWHWDAACESDKCPYGLLYEGWSAKKNQAFLTAAGWVRQLVRFLHYSRLIGGYSMSETAPPYRPGCELLQPYIGPESGSGIDTDPKAFAFVLGLLYGKLLQVQAARDVNVGANALTWLRRLTLAGKDLPELYVKVREKMLVYGTEANASVRALVAELGELGVRLGSGINLDETQTCYFLLLGQSLAVKLMPSKDTTNGESNA